MSQSHSSKDFAKVPAELQPNIPEKLLARSVINNGGADSSKFSEERHHFVSIVDLPSKTMNMTIGGLAPGQSTRRHRHNYETLIYIIEGCGNSVIEDKAVHWQAGDVVYVPVWAWHQHNNASDSEQCWYVACENAALLQNIGELALREES